MPEPIAYATTEVSADKTAHEIEEMLRKHGCNKIAKEYESGHLKAIFFQINTHEGNMPFKLPVNTEAVCRILHEKRKSAARYPYANNEIVALQARLHAQAERTAWRIIAWWLKSQLALIQTEMVSTVELFLPYMLMGEGQTFFQQLQSDNFRALMPSPDLDR